MMTTRGMRWGGQMVHGEGMYLVSQWGNLKEIDQLVDLDIGRRVI